MTRFSGSTALSSSTHTHGDPQALHHGRATPRTSGVQPAQGRPGSHSAEPAAELAGLKDELGNMRLFVRGHFPQSESLPEYGVGRNKMFVVFLTENNNKKQQ